MATDEIYQAILTFNKAKTAELVQAEIDKGTDISRILAEGLIKPLDEVGKKFSSGELFVPEMLAAAHAMKEGLKLLHPFLASTGIKTQGTIIIGTVKGDLHDIGKNIVAMMLQGAGFEVIDLGVNVEPEQFYSVAKEKAADIVALSTLLTPTMPAMEEIVILLKEKIPEVKTMVGGAPITNDFAKRIGAEGFSIDAPGAVEIARKLCDNTSQWRRQK